MSAPAQPGTEAATPNAKRTRGLSLAQKLIALIVSTSSVIIALLTSYFLTQQLTASHAALERKAATYGRLVAKEVASAIAFDDRETAREVFDSMAQDNDIDSLLLMTQTGTTLYAHGSPGAWVAAAQGGVVEQRIVALPEHIGVVTPVVSAEGPRGTLVIELSTRELSASNQRLMRTALFVAGVSVLFGGLFAFLIARSLHARLKQITGVATAVTGGDLEQPPVSVKGNDEISLLGHAFNAMLEHIQSLVQQIKLNAEQEQARLESLVNARTEELRVRNDDMRLVLDNVDQGFVGVDLHGKLSPERSAILSKWLAEPADSDTLFTWIERKFSGKGDFFRVAWDGLVEEWMPLEMRIDQLPREINTRDLSFTFAYKPVFDGETLSKLLVVMTDTTALVAMRRAEEEERELAQVVRKLLEDRTGFADFVAEADELVKAIGQKDNEWQRLRLLHTLKGNSAIFGFASLSRVCHELEGAVQERNDAGMLPEEIELLKTSWTRLKDKITGLTTSQRPGIEVSQRDYEQLLARVDAHAPPSQLRALLETWKLDPIEARLTRLAEYARGLAERLGKDPVEVHVDAHSVRLDPQAWSPIWQALVHVVRNAVDHGLETREEREASKKSAVGELSLRAHIEGSTFKLEIADRGRGIDWESVARAAKRRGLPHQTPEHLRDALLADGLSTREQATTTSGRGVGLSAVKQVCLESGGRMIIRSEPGQGTRFTFEWSIDSAYRPVPTPFGSSPANDVVRSEEGAKRKYVDAV